MENNKPNSLMVYSIILLFAVVNAVILFVGIKVTNYDSGTAIILTQILAILAIFIVTYLSQNKYNIPVGFRVPLTMVTVIYAILMDIFCFCLYKSDLSTVIIVQLILFAIYYLISIPMLCKGIKK